MVDSREIAWAGGLFEGEGCFYVPRSTANAKSFTAVAVISMTDEDTMRRFGDIMARAGIEATVRGPIRWRKHMEWKPAWEWRIYGFEKMQAFIAMLWPWLGARRKAKARETLQQPWSPPTYGIHHPAARLTYEAVEQIRQRYKEGKTTQYLLAAEHGVTQGAISMIVRGQRWAR